MSLFTVILVVLAAGVLLWLVNSYFSIDRKVKKIINAVVVIAVILWVFKVFGIFNFLMDIKI